MTQAELEHALRDLARTGTPIRRDADREVWRFDAGGQPGILSFYPRRARGISRADRAMAEFLRLQWLQKAQVPAPRAVAVLKGFRIGDRAGDAVIVEAVEPAVPLDRALSDAELAGRVLPDRPRIAAQVVEIVRLLAKANLRHLDLTLGSFLLKGDKVYLVDARGIRRGALKLGDLLRLGHSASRYVTRGEIIRAWQEVGPVATALPQDNAASPRLWQKVSRRATRENENFARVESAGWTGHGFRSAPFPYPWSTLSHMTFDPADLAHLWEDLLGRLRRGELEYLKRSASGDIAVARSRVGATHLDLVVKVPLRKQWHRYLTDPFRGDRATRAWVRAWELIARDIPTAWPLMVMRRTAAGYPLESAIVFERVDGIPLSQVDLPAMSPARRDTLFRRVGHLLRRVDDTGYYHRDAKSDNVMVDRAGRPLLVDLDGIRTPTFGRWSLPRMLRSMKQHRQYTPADSLSLCRGYAPFAHARAEAP